MTRKFTYLFLTFFITTIISCGTDNQNDTTEKNELDTSRVDTFHSGISTKVNIGSAFKDTVVLKETFNEDDIIVNEYLTDQLKPIRKNFKRINSIDNWTSIDKKDLWESTEGGEVKFYYLKGNLEKIVVRQFGETFQYMSEYYLMLGQLSFIFEKSYKYNRPLNYDSTAMKENNDNQTWDIEKSEIIEARSYFEKGKLIHQLNNQDCGSPFSDDYLLEEQKRIKTEFDKLLKLLTKK